MIEACCLLHKTSKDCLKVFQLHQDQEVGNVRTVECHLRLDKQAWSTCSWFYMFDMFVYVILFCNMLKALHVCFTPFQGLIAANE